MSTARRNLAPAALLCAALALGAAAARAEEEQAEEFRRWRLEGGGSLAYIGEHASTCVGECESTLDVDARVSPTLRLTYDWTEDLSLALDGRYDWYRWRVEDASGDRETRFRSFTVALGLAYCFEKSDPSILGMVRPVVRAALGYRVLDDEIDAPVREYENAFGGDISIGLRWQSMEARLGYSYYRHAAEDKTSGTTGADDLVLDDVFLEIMYRFWSW